MMLPAPGIDGVLTGVSLRLIQRFRSFGRLTGGQFNGRDDLHGCDRCRLSLSAGRDKGKDQE